jgi:hypothetical protein
VSIIVWTAIGALLPGCGINEDPGSPEAETAAGPTPLAAGCIGSGAVGTWSNQAFPDQLKMFHAEFDATPSASGIDAVVGLSNGSASSFAALAAIVRFNSSGMIDARAGSTYRTDGFFAYEAGKSYHVRIDVDVRTGSYSAWLRSDFGGYGAIARSYPFRTEQAGVTRLNNVASEVDSTAGTLDLCGFVVVADATTADGCLITTAGDGFATIALPDATVLDTVSFTAQATVPNIDAVIGLSSGAATRFSDLATAVRFSPTGFFDMRDGDTYRVDRSQAYSTNPLSFRVIADLGSHTYSAFVGGNADALELARQYRFRTEQSATAHLDHLTAIVDGAQGTVKVCAIRVAPSSGVAYSREGEYAVLPFANSEALLSDGATTSHVDAAGKIVATVARGGQLATDILGNIFIASVDGNTLAVDKYDPGLAPRWHATGTVLAGATITAMAADPSGAVVIGVVTQQEGTVSVFRFTAGGAFESLMSASGRALTIDGDQPIVASNDGANLRITRFAAGGSTVWSRDFAGNATITAMTVDPNHNLLFGGELQTAMDFGGGTLPLFHTDNGGAANAFFVKLSSTGAHVFSRKTGYAALGGIAANASRILVSTTERTQFHYVRLLSFDPSGTPAAGPRFSTGLGEFGFGGRISIGPSGRVWWNVVTQWPFFPQWRYFVALTE